jgi:hypothetical protein
MIAYEQIISPETVFVPKYISQRYQLGIVRRDGILGHKLLVNDSIK